jgi:DMSO/TMAO reductase YedYZ molybdopterin-dependent catalytic subunit
MQRRKFLQTIWWLGIGGSAVACRPNSNNNPPTLYRGTALPTPTALPATAIAVTLPALPSSPPRTDIADLYTMSFRGTPEIDADSWRLRIDGLVTAPLTLTLAEIQARPAQTVTRTLQCISNPTGGGLVGNVQWTGTALAPILAEAGVLATAQYVWFEALDGYTTSLPVAALQDVETLLVYAADELPLPPEHGYPLRLLVAGRYGQKQPKWITRLHFAETDQLGYWESEARGWSNTAFVLTNSLIRQPGRNALPFASPIRVEGMAFAGQRRITRVELGIGPDIEQLVWADTTLIIGNAPLEWTWWAYDWQPPAAGIYTLAVRATDESGFRQERFASSLIGRPYPDGSNVIHKLAVKVG